MNKQQKVILYTAIAVAVALVALVGVLIYSNNSRTISLNEAEARADSLALANDRLVLTNEFNELNANFNMYEDQQMYLKNDSLVQQYNQARMKVEGLLQELDKEKKSNAANRARIKQLEGEIATLRGILKHYLEEIDRLSKENESLKKDLEEVRSRNEQLTSAVTVATKSNEELTQTVKQAKKLNITGLHISALNKKGKAEKKIGKVQQLAVGFTVSPNTTAAAGMKDFYVRIVTPEGSLLGGNVTFPMDGANVPATAHRQVEYSNDEISVTIYWDVNTTLTAGDYTVEVFCDGYRLASRHFQLGK
ncbi:MAG: hypothetical protein K2K32_00605 [Muribaculaceae bacterium]|nr:hypothetical protein [Muribaculaceae bacterium]